MSDRAALVVVLACFTALTGCRSAAPRHASPYALVFAGDVPQPTSWTLAELKRLPRVQTDGKGFEGGQRHSYEGVPVLELLFRVGAIPVGELHGAALTTYVLAIADDGSQVLFSLFELDEDMSAHVIVVVDTVDGQPLSEAQGLLLVANRDIGGTRLVKRLRRLEVVHPPARRLAKAYKLEIAGDVPKHATWTVAELKTLPRVVCTGCVSFDDRGGHEYEGVRVRELLVRAGAMAGGKLSKDALTAYVLATASDGFQVLFSLVELDSESTGHDIIIVDTVDGHPLDASDGPFRLLTPRDIVGKRSMSRLKRLEVVRLRR
jgi:DMSO/TMAO reductase YedYZ molybdopterin-dependent catalytic subunit